jgi:hypothetical protein
LSRLDGWQQESAGHHRAAADARGDREPAAEGFDPIANPGQTKSPDAATCASADQAKSKTALAAEYQWTLTRNDALKYGTDDDKAAAATDYPITFITKLENGHWTQAQTAQDAGIESAAPLRDPISGLRS